MLSVINDINRIMVERLIDDIDAPYKDSGLNIVSTSDKTPDEFPTLSVVSLGETTAASDLEGREQAAILSTLELKAYTDTTLNDASGLMDEAGSILVSLGYDVRFGPETLSDIRPYCKVARFRAFVGAGDIGWRFR